MRPIDADALKAHIDKLPALPDGNFVGTHSALKALINMQPTIDAVPVVRGKRKDVEVTYVADKTTLPFECISSMRCNQCNRYYTEIYYYGNPTEMTHFCPNCGADMREEIDHD